MRKVKHLRFIAPGLLLLISGLLACSQEQGSAPLKKTDYPEYESEPAKLYLSKCSGCHAAPLPGIHTMRQWPGVVDRMQMRMKNKAVQPLNSNELAIVLDYLQKHASQK
ncbi:hypothetical protein [Kaarinaea lacus]